VTTPVPEQTTDKMTWDPNDVEFVKKTTKPAKKSAAQRLADRIRRGDGPDDQHRR